MRCFHDLSHRIPVIFSGQILFLTLPLNISARLGHGVQPASFNDRRVFLRDNPLIFEKYRSQQQ